MEAVQTLLVTLPLALTSGINLYATVLVVGLGVRFGLFSHVPPGLGVLASWPVILVAGACFVVEFLADKIHVVEHIWDFIHTIIRPLGAAAIAFFAAYGEVDPVLTAALVLLAGGVGTLSHTVKAGLRPVITVIPGANIAISLAEDVLAVGLSILALANPYVAAALAVAILLVMVLVVPRVLRWGWFRISATVARLVAVFTGRRESDPLTVAELVRLDHEVPLVASRCKTQKIRWVAGRTGRLCLMHGRLAFLYRKWFGRTRLWQVGRDRIHAVYFLRRWLVDVLEVHYRDARDNPRVARFVFTRYRSLLAEQFARRLGARGLPDAAAPAVAAGQAAPAGA